MTADPPLLAPFEPTPNAPFDLAAAGHLLRRVACGGALYERERLVRVGIDAAVAELVAPALADTPPPDDPHLDAVLAFGGLARLRAHRFWRIVHATSPLVDRVTLFWHGHFATSDEKLRDERLMAAQFATFDRLGLCRFDDLLLAMVRDPALLKWLDADTSKKGKPNENFARELFELFALGRGAYAESDVRAAARALTGARVVAGAYRFDAGGHDDGAKTLFGASGAFRDDDVVRLTVRRPDCERFVAAKLLATFVHPEPNVAEVDAVAAALRAHDRHVGRTLAELLRSRLFFSMRARRSRVRAPIEFVVGVARDLDAKPKPDTLADAAAAAGQILFEPPSVEGWRGGRDWLTSAAWIARTNFVGRLSLPVETLFAGAASARERAHRALTLLVDDVVADASRAAIEHFAASPAADGPSGKSALLCAVAQLPEVHLT